VIIALAGFREPIIVILFLIAFFSAISGKPLDGLLLLIVAAGLAWDAAARYHRRVVGAGSGGGSGGTQTGHPADVGTAVSAETTAPRGGHPAAETLRRPATRAPATRAPGARAPGAGRRRVPLVLAALAGAAAYAGVVGSFSRYSWPATVGVIAVGAAVVVVGWRGPLRRRPDPGKLPLPGAAAWAGLLVAGGLWELASLLQQPDLTTTSYAHPTVSALTDPLLASHGGRSVALAVWLVIGWFLVER